MRKVIIDTDFATVWAYPENKMIRHKLKKFIYGEHFREVMLAGANAFKEYNCTKWLSDDKENSTLAAKDKEWVTNVWEPMVIKSGWKHWAIVMPVKIFGEANMKNISKRLEETGIVVKHFSDDEEAFSWLELQ